MNFDNKAGLPQDNYSKDSEFYRAMTDRTAVSRTTKDTKDKQRRSSRTYTGLAWNHLACRMAL